MLRQIGFTRVLQENRCILGLENNGIIILDCEYVNTTNSYYVFDIAVYDGKYFGNTPWSPRQQKVEEIVNDLSSCSEDLIIYAKPYNEFDSFDSLKSLYGEYSRLEQYEMDGLIFVDKRQGYINPVYKWKSHSTIDLELSADFYNGELYACTCDGKIVDIQIENPLFVLENDKIAKIATLVPETFNENIGKFQKINKSWCMGAII